MLVPAPAQRCLGNHPLQDAGVLPAGGDQVTVVVQEGHVGHMTAVTPVLVTRSLENTGIIHQFMYRKSENTLICRTLRTCFKLIQVNNVSSMKRPFFK